MIQQFLPKNGGVLQNLCVVISVTAILAFSEGDFFISDPKEKVNVFNDYFASQATVPNSDSTEISFVPRWSSDSLSVITADEEMVRNLMSPVNISKATGYHGISNKIIIHCSEGLYKPFTSLINTSFRLGQYPSACKLANVLPLLKNDRQLKTNYRPGSLLPCLSKICEEVAFFHLFNFLNMIGFFYKFQSGFRLGDSTVMQLVILFTKFMRPLRKAVR